MNWPAFNNANKNTFLPWMQKAVIENESRWSGPCLTWHIAMAFFMHFSVSLAIAFLHLNILLHLVFNFSWKLRRCGESTAGLVTDIAFFSWSKHCLVWEENQLLLPQWGDYSLLSNNFIVWDLISQGFVLRICGSPSITSGITKKLNKDTARCWSPWFKYMSVSREKAKWIN